MKVNNAEKVAILANVENVLGREAMNRLSWFGWTALVLGLGFLYAPILLLVAYSFNALRLVTVWGGFSTR